MSEPTFREFFTITEVAQHFRVPKKTVYTWTSQRRIGYFRPGRELRFTAEDIATFEEQTRIAPLPPQTVKL